MTCTYGFVRSRKPGVLNRCAVQQVVPLQKPIEATEETSEEYDLHWDRSSLGQGCKDEASAGDEQQPSTELHLHHLLP